MLGTIVLWVVVGLIAGIIAQALTRQSADVTAAPNWLETIVVGIIGAVVGGWVLAAFGLAGAGFLWTLLTAVIGACLLLLIVGALRRRDYISRR